MGIVMPFHNEEDRLRENLPELFAFAAGNPEFHFLLADDCSTDGGPALIKQALRSRPLPNITLRSNPANLGKALTVKQAILSLPHPLVAFLDGDMAYPLALLIPLKNALATADIVIGSRPENSLRSGRNSIRRALLGQGFNTLACSLFGFTFRDTQAGIKAFRRPAAHHVFSRLRITSFAFDVELLVIARASRFSVAEMEALPRPTHTYKKSHIRLVVSSALMLRDLLLIKYYAARGLYD